MPRPSPHAAVALLCCACGAGLARAEAYSCVSFEYPPLVTQGGGNAPTGLAVDLARHLFNRLGHSVSVTLYPWARALEMVRNGDADCVFTLFWSPERARFLDYTQQSIIEQDIVLYVRADSHITFDGELARLQGRRIGTAHKINYGPRFESMRPFLLLDEAPTIEHNFLKLLAGRVDMVVSYAATGDAYLAAASRRSQAHRIVRLPLPIESVPTHIAFSKARKLTGLRDHLDAEIGRLRASPDYSRMVRRYSPDGVATQLRVARAEK